MFSDSRCSSTIAAIAVCTALAACGKSGGEAKPASQVAVKVNGDEITVHQINQVLARAGRIAPEQAKAASRQILEQLVDQQLLVQKAIEGKFDRSPEVVAALEAARQQVLAQAYMEKSVTSVAVRPGADEVKRFFDARPELFAQRRIYRLQEIVTDVGRDKAPALLELVRETKNLSDVVAFLRGNDIKFNANTAVRPAEQFPLDALPMVAKMKEGEITSMRNGSRTTIMQLVSSQLTPLSEAEATPFIEQFLLKQKRGELAGAEMKRLRQSAKLEYIGEFTQQAAAQAPASAAANVVSAVAVTPSSVAAPRVGEALSAGSSAGGGAPAKVLDSAFDKGLKGLK